MHEKATSNLSRRDFLARGSAAAGGLVGAAALGPGVVQAANHETARAEDSVTLTFWSHQFTPRETLDKQVIADFERQNPGVKVNYGVFTDPITTKVNTAIASGNGPDLFNMFTIDADPLALSGAVAPVDPQSVGFGSVSALRSQYLPGILNGLVWNNNLYALPTEVSNYALFINKLHFQEAGLNPATQYPRTWDDVVRLSKKLTIVKNGKVVRRGFDFEYGSANDQTAPQFNLGGMAYQYGGRLFSSDGKTSLINTAPWVKALTFYYDYVHTLKLGFPAMTVDETDFTNGKEGNLSMLLSGDWYAASVQGTNKNVYQHVMTAPFPRFKDATHSNGAMLYAYALFVNASSSSQKQKLAWKLIGMLTSRAPQYLAQAGLLEPRRDLPNSPVYKNNALIKPFLADASTSYYWPATHQNTEVLAAVGRAIQRSTQTSVTPQQSLDTAKQDIDKILAGG